MTTVTIFIKQIEPVKSSQSVPGHANFLYSYSIKSLVFRANTDLICKAWAFSHIWPLLPFRSSFFYQPINHCLYINKCGLLNISFTIIIVQPMALRSQVLSIQLPDASGKTVPYFTYDGYLEESERHRIRAERKNAEQLKVTGGALFGFIAYVATRRLSLPVLALKGIHVPVSGLFSGFVGGVLGYEIFSFIGSSRVSSLKRDTILSAKHLPLWSNLRNAVNPDRAYFELADERHNEPLLFHSGLTPESAARLIPDKVIGKAPHKPHLGSAHDHGHGHH